jgi:predicted permease
MIGDLKYAARVLRKSPAFTLLVVVMLALGMGANTAMFSIFDVWLLRPLHFPDAERLTIVLKSEVSSPREPKIFDGYRDWEVWARQSHSFVNLAGVFWRSFEARNGDEGVFGMIVTSNLFDTLGVKPRRGRTFRPEDLDGPPVAVIGYDLWQNRFHAATDILGQHIALGSKNYQIVGVMPRGFGLRMINQENDTQFYALIQKDEAGYSAGGSAPIAVIGRLEPGASIAAAQAELSGIQRSLDQIHPENPKGYTVLVSNLQADNTRNVRASLSLSAAALGFILLIVCANVGSLLLGRTLQRRREMAIRAALGSGRRRIVRQLLIESSVIAALGAAAGVLIAYAAIQIFVAVNPFGRMPPNAIALDWRALAFTLLASLASTLIFGLAPALEAARVDLNQTMKAATRNVAGGGPGAFRLRGLLVSGQVALSLILVVGAALLTETLVKLESQPLGFRAEGVTVASVGIPKERSNEAQQRMLEKLRSTSGIDSAAVSNITPLGSGAENRISIEGQPAQREDLAPKAGSQSVTPGYFQTLNIPLLAGRPFAEDDKQDSTPVAILNRTAAERWFGPRKAIGARVKLPDDKNWRTVVGIVGDTSYTFYNTLEWLSGPRMFVPFTQAREDLSPVAREVYVIIRGRPMTAETARSLLKSINPDLRLGRLRSLSDLVDEVVEQPRLRTRLLGAVAALSLLLAAIGIYGVMAQSVIQRTQEIGIRMALGAKSADLVRMVVTEGVRLALLGIAVGILGALALTRIIANLLYGVKPTDAATFIAAAFALLIAVALAGLIPAQAATKVDPMTALRQE